MAIWLEGIVFWWKSLLNGRIEYVFVISFDLTFSFLGMPPGSTFDSISSAMICCGQKSYKVPLVRTYYIYNTLSTVVQYCSTRTDFLLYAINRHLARIKTVSILLNYFQLFICIMCEIGRKCWSFGGNFNFTDVGTNETVNTVNKWNMQECQDTENWEENCLVWVHKLRKHHKNTKRERWREQLLASFVQID